MLADLDLPGGALPRTDGSRGGLHQLLHSLRRDWPRLTLDVLVLILGISISFWIEKRRSSLGDRKKEQYALTAVHDDLVRDTLTITADMRRLHDQASQLGALLDSARTMALPADTVAEIINGAATQYLSFILSESAFDQMKQTGTSQTIRNRNLARMLTAFYSSGMRNLYAWDDIAREHNAYRIAPYVTEHVPFSMALLAHQQAGLLPNGAFGTMVRFTAADYRSLASSPAFLKLILRQQYIKIRQGQRYGAVLTEMRALITSLDEELAKQR